MIDKQGWNFVRSPEDYFKLQHAFAADTKWDHANIHWSEAPARYPVMVRFTQPGFFRVEVTFFYEHDAVKLLLFSGYAVDQISPQKVVTFPDGRTMSDVGFAPEAPPPPVLVEPQGVSPSQSECNRSVAANLLSLLQVLIRRGLISAETYQTAYAGNLAVVDRWHANDVENRQKIERAVEGVSVILPPAS